MTSKIHWRCFHCGDAFTKAQERHARDHFGADCAAMPICLMRVPGEYQLLTMLRKAQDELARYRAEDSDTHRAIYAMAADHAEALRREEERGYAKGVADARAELSTPSQPWDGVTERRKGTVMRHADGRVWRPKNTGGTSPRWYPDRRKPPAQPEGDR